MNKKLIAVIFIACLLNATVSFSQNKAEKKVAGTVENLRIAMINADSAALAALTSDKLSYGHSHGQIEDKSGFIQSLTSGKSDFVTINLTEQNITLFDNTAVVRHVLTADTKDDGKPGSVKLAVLTIWHKEKGKWKLIARQAVKMQ